MTSIKVKFARLLPSKRRTLHLSNNPIIVVQSFVPVAKLFRQSGIQF